MELKTLLVNGGNKEEIRIAADKAKTEKNLVLAEALEFAYEACDLDLFTEIWNALVNPINFNFVTDNLISILSSLPFNGKYIENYGFIVNELRNKGRNFIHFTRPYNIYTGKVDDKDLTALIGNGVWTRNDINAIILIDKGDLVTEHVASKYVENNMFSYYGIPEILDFMVAKFNFKLSSNMLNYMVFFCNIDLLKYCLNKFPNLAKKYRVVKTYVNGATGRESMCAVRMFHFLFDELQIPIEIKYLKGCLTDKNIEGFKYLYDKARYGSEVNNDEIKSLTRTAKYHGIIKEFREIVGI